MTKVQDLMTWEPKLVDPEATLNEAARSMKDIDCGCLLVGASDRPEGIITDRDIVIRAIAEGKDPFREKVRDYMTRSLHSCKEGDTVEDAARIMHQNQVSRLVVQNDEGKTTGVLTFGHIIRELEDDGEAQQVVACAAA